MKEKQIAENAMAYALKHGADQCEIYWLRRASSSTLMRDGVIADDTSSDLWGYSVRLIRNGVTGFSYGSRPEAESLRRSVDDALLSCDFLEKDPHYHFTAPGKKYPKVDFVPKEEIGFGRKKEILEEITAAAKTDERIRRVERASLGESFGSVHLMNSLGLDLYRESSYVTASAAVVAADGEEEQIGSEFKAANRWDDFDFSCIGRKAAEDGLDKLGAEVLETEELPVLFRPDAVIDLLGILIPSFMGDHVEKGMSRLKRRLGEKIAADGVFLYEDALMDESVLKIPFDDEGQPCGKKALIENGVAKTFLYNNEYASRAGRESTGNGFCSSHKGLPGVGLSSFYLAKGNVPLEKIIAKQEKALWVRDLMGLHMADAVSGDFSLGATGKLIEGGEMSKGVRGIMIAGNLFDLFRDIEAIGNDFTVFGDVGSPSFLIKSLKISGK